MLGQRERKERGRGPKVALVSALDPHRTVSLDAYDGRRHYGPGIHTQSPLPHAPWHHPLPQSCSKTKGLALLAGGTGTGSGIS